jgi:hypothetical protein
MKYTLLLVGHDRATGPWDTLTEEQQGVEMAKHYEFSNACEARDGVALVGGEQLMDGSGATTLRTINGEMTITDGPFAEAAEQIGGFYVIDAPDLDTVIELCRILPAYDIDIRPVIPQPEPG